MKLIRREEFKANRKNIKNEVNKMKLQDRQSGNLLDPMEDIYRTFQAFSSKMTLFSIRMLDTEKQTLELVFKEAKHKKSKMPEAIQSVPVYGTASGEAISHGKPYYVDDLSDPHKGRLFYEKRAELVKDGYLSFVSIPLFNDYGDSREIIGVVNIYTGTKGRIDAEHKAVQSLCRTISHVFIAQKQNEEIKKLEERNHRNTQHAIMGRIAALAVHELKQPLVSIGGFVRRIEKDPNNIRQIKKYTPIIVQEVIRMERLVQDILSFATKEPKKEEVDIIGLIKSVINSVYTDGIKITTNFHQDIQFISVDPAQINSAVRNLLQNAVDSSQENDKKEILCRTSLYDKGGRHSLCIEIENSGTIPVEKLNKIFEFSFTTKEKGTGIGLSSAMVVAEMHDGTIKCKNKNNSVVFRLYLPRP